MKPHSNEYDAIIIGGGPAGSTAATYLAKGGHRVLVLEKERFPREHVGESLLPFCYAIFEEIGVIEEMSRRFVRKPGVRFVDVDGRFNTTWCFGHVIKDESRLSFHVIRAEFDQLLLQNSRRHGAVVKEQTAVKDVDLEASDGGVVVHAEGPRGGKQRYKAKFLLDASGRNTFLANRLKLKRPHPNLDRAALSTHWLGARFEGGIEEGLLQIVYLGGEKKGWIWVIPVTPERVSVGIVLNHAYIRSEKRRLTKKRGNDWQETLYRQVLNESPFVRRILENADIAQPLMFNGDYSYSVTKKYGTNFAMIGDSSTFIDPIFASGVYLSMNCARIVTRAVDQIIGGDHQQGFEMLDQAYAKVNGAYRLVDKAIQFFYNPASINLAQFSSAETLIHSQHENALAAGHYLLAGDFFERHEEYSELIDLLQNPRLYQKYKQLVIDRPSFQNPTCGASRDEIFHTLLEASDKEALLAES